MSAQFIVKLTLEELIHLQKIESKAVELSVAVINDPHTMELGCLCREILELTGEQRRIVAMKATPTAANGREEGVEGAQGD